MCKPCVTTNVVYVVYERRCRETEKGKHTRDAVEEKRDKQVLILKYFLLEDAPCAGL